MVDKLDECFSMQEAFMRRLAQANVGFPQGWPLDLSQKSSQVEVRDAVFHSIEELIEVVRELKNAKKHRQTEVKEFDRDKLVEECVDSFKLFLEALIFMGVTPDEFFQAYQRKDAIIHARLDEKY